MSDVLPSSQPKAVLLPGLTNPQMVLTARIAEYQMCLPARPPTQQEVHGIPCRPINDQDAREISCVEGLSYDLKVRGVMTAELQRGQK